MGKAGYFVHIYKAGLVNPVQKRIYVSGTNHLELEWTRFLRVMQGGSRGVEEGERGRLGEGGRGRGRVASPQMYLPLA